jgi:Cytochrome P450
MAFTLLAPNVSFLLLWLPLLVVVWLAGGIVYRLFFHRLAHIPGPWVAACTYLYAFYFNVIVGDSRFYIQIEKLHQKYGMALGLCLVSRVTLLICGLGPVVRIAPDEVHLSDPENYDKIYQLGTKYLKSPRYYQSFGLSASTFGTLDAQLHRARRAAISPRFSRKMVLELEGVVQSKVMKLCCEVAERLDANKPVDIYHGFRAVTADVITDYAFDNCYNLLDQEDFGVDYSSMSREFAPTFWVFMQWPLLQSVVMNAPMWLAKRLSKAAGTYMEIMKVPI